MTSKSIMRFALLKQSLEDEISVSKKQLSQATLQKSFHRSLWFDPGGRVVRGTQILRLQRCERMQIL